MRVPPCDIAAAALRFLATCMCFSSCSRTRDLGRLFLSDLGTVGRFGLRHSKSRPARTWRGPVTGEMGCVVFVKLDGFRLLVTAEVLGGWTGVSGEGSLLMCL